MIGYTSATRTDMSECCVKRRLFNAKPGDSRLRKMLLDKDYLE